MDMVKMMRRKIERKLIEWKNRERHKSLIITGARQVGKTYSVREFGKTYKSFIEINFIEHPEYKMIFADTFDVESIRIGISSMIKEARLIEYDTLILLDEIQECSGAVQALKFFTDDGRYDVIATGSALGMKLRNGISYPVGYVEYIDMYALDLEEFLWAAGIPDEVITNVREFAKKEEKIPLAVHQKMVGLLKEYMVVGGMPEVVNAYSQDRNLRLADEIQRRIYRDYINDIAYLAPYNIRLKVEKCYTSIQMQLTKDNHKFQYGIVEKKATATKYETSIDWLEAAFIAKRIYNTKRIEYPLKAFATEGNFRVYNTDIGLYMAGFDYSLKLAILNDGELEDAADGIVLGTAKGGIYEALVADMLIKKNIHDIYFFKDDKNTSEIEFMVETEDGVLPIEVKAGRKKANSLNNILKDERIKKGIKLSLRNVGRSDKCLTLPIYMVALYL